MACKLVLAEAGEKTVYNLKMMLCVLGRKHSPNKPYAPEGLNTRAYGTTCKLIVLHMRNIYYALNNAAILCLNHCNNFSSYCASWTEERKKKEDRYLT